MAISDYLKDLRARIGTTLVLMPAANGLILDDDGRVLLARAASADVWVLPGGAVDPDEPPQDAVVREVWEEVGLHVEPTRCLGTFGGPDFQVTYANGDRVSYVSTIYECRRLGGTLRPDGDEILEARWVAASELATIGLARSMRTLVPELMARRHAGWVPPVGWRPPTR
jgi:8-oxo-dGTP pyrophosphatase MutT (NUDIX family)